MMPGAIMGTRFCCRTLLLLSTDLASPCTLIMHLTLPRWGDIVSRQPTELGPALERSLRVLETLASSRSGLTLSELAKVLELPKSSTHRLLYTLTSQGYLVRDAN